MIRWYAIYKNEGQWNKSAYFDLIKALQDYMEVRKVIVNGSKVLGYPEPAHLLKKPTKFGVNEPKVKKIELFRHN